MVGISDVNISVKPAGPASKASKPDSEIEIIDIDDSDDNAGIETNEMEIPLNIPVGAKKKKKSAFIDFGTDDGDIDPDEFRFEFQNIVKNEPIPKIEMKDENRRKRSKVKDENRRNLDDIADLTFQSDSTIIKDEIKFENSDESIKKE